MYSLGIYESRSKKIYEAHSYVLISLSMLIVCGMTASAIVASKLIDFFGLIFPFSNITFTLFTFPIIDAICELYGKKKAYLVSVLGVIAQILFVLVINVSVIFPHASIWHHEEVYELILLKSKFVVLATIIGFGIAQFIDVYIFQYIKNLCHGRWLWLRCLFSSTLGQLVDSIIFTFIVFWSFKGKYVLIKGAFITKTILCFFGVFVTYLIVIIVKNYINKWKFKDANQIVIE